MKRLWNDGSADGLAVSHDGKTLYFERTSLTSPAAIYSMTRTGAATKVTHDNEATLSPVAMGAPLCSAT